MPPSGYDAIVELPLLVLLGVIAFRVPGKLMWDSKAMRFTNSEAANKFLRPEFRRGWELKL